MNKLSIIVPVYNVEPYLRKCIDSLIAQNYDSYEIVLVDDGSSDGCAQICDQYAQKSQESRAKSQEYPFIRVIHQANGGLSAARNAGLKLVQGKYVCFVDSDDYWEQNVLGELMKKVEREQLDVLRFDYRNVRLVTNERMKKSFEQEQDKNELTKVGRYEVFEPNKESRYIDRCNEVVDGEAYLNTRMGYACYAVMYIMRREIVPKFTEGIHFEDVEWLPRMMLKAKKVNSTTTIVYNYLVRQGSITKVQGDKDKIRKNTENRLLIIDKYRQYIEQYPSCRWLRNMQSSMTAGVIMTIARELFKEREEYIKRLNALDVLPLSIAEQGKTYRRRALLINILGPRIYFVIMHVLQRRKT